MPVMVQIRNVPDDVHRTLKSRAALNGMSLSDYLLREIRASAALPTLQEMQARLAALPPLPAPPVSAARIIREERDRG